MKKKIMLLLTAVMLTVAAHAQQDSLSQMRFGYISYEKVLQAMPDYTLAQKTLADLRAQYEAEQQRVEQEFNSKYEEFLEGMRDFPETILRKRQTELKELLERNIAFKAESRRQLAQAETETMTPLKEKLAAAIAKVATERGYAFILNTDREAVPFINPLMGDDVNQLVRDALK